MFDIWLRRRIDPVLDQMAIAAVRAGLSANFLTAIGAAAGLCAAIAIAHGQFSIGLALIVLNRLLDGLDGAVARIKGATQWGGYLDITADYSFYTAVPVGFAFAADANVLPALLLVSSFVMTAVSFLALAAILAGRDTGYGQKSFSYTTGLIEGGETIAAFILMCILPQFFTHCATVLAGLCLLTAAQRLSLARDLLR
jgi:phosphatidylglycerophosphate synthase